jgi:DNA mismatch repair protein MutL
MTTLVERLQGCANPMHCPHGRPTMIRLSTDDIARMFKRV